MDLKITLRIIRGLLCAICLTFPSTALGTSRSVLCYHDAVTTKTISGENDQLQDALNGLKAGDCLEIQEGSFTGDFTVSSNGTAEHPIVIKAGGKMGSVVFRDARFIITGHYTVLTGMDFQNSMVEIEGDNNRVTRNLFRDGQTGGNSARLHSAVVIWRGASNNRVDHNEIKDWRRRALRNRSITARTNNNRFDQNYLHNLTGANPKSNSGEAFQIGAGHHDPAFSPRTCIEFNLVDTFSNEGELLSIKSNENYFLNNTIKNVTLGCINARSGSRNIIKNNHLDNAQFISILADSNQVIGNELINSSIRLRSGDCLAPWLLLKGGHTPEFGDVPDNKYRYQGGHPAARYTLVAANIFRKGSYIELGKRATGSRVYPSTHSPCLNTLLIGNGPAQDNWRNAGSVSGVKTEPDYKGDAGTVIVLTPSDVGLTAADRFCPHDQSN